MNCERCGATAAPGSERCAYCGGFFDVHPSGDQATQPAPQPVIVNVYHTAPSQLAVSDKKRWTAFFLCLFLGWMGVHKFYLGKIGMGVLYFFTFGVFGIGWAIDLILLLFGISRDYQGRKLA